MNRQFHGFSIQAVTSILGSVGQGTSTEEPNFLQQVNAASLGPNISPAVTQWDSSPFTARTTGKVIVVGQMIADAQAAGQNVIFHLTIDDVFQPNVVGAATSGTDALAPLTFIASSTVIGIYSVVVGVPHVYGIQCLNQHVGQTTFVPAGQANILIYELP